MTGVDGWFWVSLLIIGAAVVFDIVRIRKGRKKQGRISDFGLLVGT